MSRIRRQRAEERENRLREARGAAAEVEDQTKTMKDQVGFVGKLSAGWRRVHEINHLAQLFSDEGRIG